MSPSKERKPGWQNDYIRRTYDRLNILIPKGQKATIERAAQEANESINQFTNQALLKHMNLTQWPETENENKQID